MSQYYFYDLETSGVNARSARIMQFGGQRTDMDFKPIGPPDVFLLKLAPDVLPEPDAVLITGITPQKTLSDGITEAEFTRYFNEKIARPGTIFTGFNSVRFDDEFMRFLLWRNFFDAYRWQWQDGSSRWDLLDVSRMVRALRPDGLNWPFSSDGKPTNRLELLASVNKISHDNAHDALADVRATLELAKLIRLKQPKIYDFLLQIRSKNEVIKLVKQNQLFVYSSGRYPSEYQKTSVVTVLADHPDKQAVLVYDLRVSPKPYLDLKLAELRKLYLDRGPEKEYFPVKTLQFNKCPAVAPISVLNQETNQRLGLDKQTLTENFKILNSAQDFAAKVVELTKEIKAQYQNQLITDAQTVDGQLYDGFVAPPDETKMSLVRAASEKEIANLKPDFNDERLKYLFELYKARNFPGSINKDSRKQWQAYRKSKLLSGGKSSQMAKYFSRINELEQSDWVSPKQRQLLKELQKYGEDLKSQLNKT